MRDNYERLIAKFKAQGMGDVEAILATNDEMEKLGLYPKTPKLVATKVAAPPPGAVAIEIQEMQFQVGLFPDIEKAIEKPGDRVRFYGSYIAHRDYDTSEALNALIGSGAREFYIRCDRGVFHLTIEK